MGKTLINKKAELRKNEIFYLIQDVSTWTWAILHFYSNKMICGSKTQKYFVFEYYFERNIDRFS